MNEFLLTIVLVLLLVIVMLAVVLRLVFRVGHPYAGAVVPPATPIGGGNGGSGVINFLALILIVGLAYIFLRPEPAQPQANYRSKQEHSLEHTADPPSYHDDVSEDEAPKATQERDYPEPLRVHEMEYEKPEPEITRYNQAPRKQEDSFYAIQIGAFADDYYAQRSYEGLRQTFDQLHIIYVFGDNAPFKIVIGKFSNREKAQEYQRVQGIEGYVRFFDY
ncbi:MAG: SPOR domain-containing protein [Bacteroidota bacterium]